MEGITNLSAAVQDVLCRSGWHPGHFFDTAEFEQYLRSDGFPVFEEALDCVRRFGGLVIRYPSPVLSSTMTCILGDRHAMPGVHSPRQYEDEVAEPMCPVGGVESGNLDVWMTCSGRVLVTHGYLVLQGGDSFVDFLNNICARRRFEPYEYD